MPLGKSRKTTSLTYTSELFGASEEEPSDVDNSEDSENGNIAMFLVIRTGFTNTLQPRRLRN